MAKLERNLAIDIGSIGLRVTEFEFPPTGGLILHNFKETIFPEQITEANRTEVIGDTLSKVYEEGGFTTKRAAVSISGQAAFMRFVSLPPVSEEESRIKQIVEYEAKQNVPFPMNEVIWDYQLLSGGEEDLEVMFVVIKHDIIESITQAVSDSGLKPIRVDFAPAALYNVARANHIGDNGCAMVLNIGGRCTTLLFLDGQRFFARTIPIGGFSITQQVSKEFGISNEEAETLKQRHGFVALGGAYEEPESEVAATISKIVRNVMTRLHGEVNRSISVYRTQQKGNKPNHLYMCGGSSTMAFTDNFFSEKLRLEVSYFNPFKIVTMGENMDIKQLEKSAHGLAESVGVALRSSLECPVEINLEPPSLRKAQSFAARRPFIIAACAVWIAIQALFITVNAKTVSLFKETSERKSANVDRLQKIQEKIMALQDQQTKVVDKFESLKSMIDTRYIWSDFLNALQATKPQDVWISQITRRAAPRAAVASKSKKGKKKKKKGKKKGSKGEAVWFDVQGFSIAIHGEQPPRQVFTDEQVALFEARRARAQAEAEAEGEEPDPDDPRLDQFWGENKMESSYILPEIFLRSLRASEAFSGDTSDTRIIETNFSEVYSNLTTFGIQLTLEDPIPLER